MVWGKSPHQSRERASLPCFPRDAYRAAPSLCESQLRLVPLSPVRSTLRRSPATLSDRRSTQRSRCRCYGYEIAMALQLGKTHPTLAQIGSVKRHDDGVPAPRERVLSALQDRCLASSPQPPPNSPSSPRPQSFPPARLS